MGDVSRVGVSGPLGPFVAGFVAELSRQGFQPVTVGKQVGLLAGLSGWVAAEGVAVSGLSSEVAERFWVDRVRPFVVRSDGRSRREQRSESGNQPQRPRVLDRQSSA